MSFLKLMPARALLAAVVFAAFSIPAQAELEISVSGDKQRMVAKQLAAAITAIDYDTRDITLEGPLGETVTLRAGEEIKRLEEFKVGDLVVTGYVESLSGELRAPTEEEMEVPWVELGAAEIADKASLPGVAAGQGVRALCTIEGMNRATRSVTVRDPNGHYHVIGNVDPANMEGVDLGQTIIITFTRAIAVTLERHESN